MPSKKERPISGVNAEVVLSKPGILVREIQIDNSKILPADEGRIAYQNRQTPRANPYQEDDWKHDEWWFGWKTEEECDQGEAYDWGTDSFKQED